VANPIVEFQRHFQMWKFTVSHGMLLLRSTKSPNHPTRVDVLFKNVARINMPTTFDGFIVSAASEAETQDLVQQLGTLALHRRHTFLIEGSNFRGHVVAGIVVWHEDEGEYSQPSVLTSGDFCAKTKWPVQ